MVAAGAEMNVYNKFTGEPIGSVPKATRDDTAAAVAAAYAAFRAGPLPPYRRFEILQGAARLVLEQKDRLARLIAAEAGKPLKEALLEVDRSVQTLELSGEEAKRIHGEEIPVAASPGSENRLAFTVRDPVGVVAAISPFNFPLNLVAHKVGPALAAGNTVVLKPASSTPLTSLELAEVFTEAGLPPGHLQVVTGSGSEVGEWLLADERIAFYTFTGSPAVGSRIKAASGLRGVALELGSTSAAIICADADLDTAADLSARRAFANAGQVCLSVQRVLVHEDVMDEFQQKFLAVTGSLSVGDPLDPDTDVGPMISEAEASRAEAWIQEAVEGGASVLAGGTRQGPLLQPTVLAGAGPDDKVVCEEIFAPVVTLIPFAEIDEAIAAVNDSPYGLQAGIFTRDIDTAFRAARRIHAGGVIINDTPAYRADLMPYGGVKNSGIGREGPRYAVEAMTELKVIVLNL